MNLEELLQYTAEEYLDDRTELVSGDADSLWSDSFLVRQLNEAQRRLARFAWVIQDYANPTAGTLVLKTDTPQYALHKSVLRVFFATLSDDETATPLGRFTDVQLRTPRPWALDQDFADAVSAGTTDATGRPVGIATDIGMRTLRVYRTPSSTENGLKLYLKVARLPITWLTLDDLIAEPEVPEDYHYALCTFAAGKALTQPNVDGAMRAIGRDLLDEFRDEMRNARRDRQRAEAAPNNWYFNTSTAVLDGEER